jgi:hypothetical protein
MAPKRAPGVTEKVKIRQAVLIDELRKLEWSPAPHTTATASYRSAPPAISAGCSKPPLTPHHAQQRRWHSNPAEQQERQPPRRAPCVVSPAVGRTSYVEEEEEDKKRKLRPVEALRVVLGLRPRRKSFQKCLAQQL